MQYLLVSWLLIGVLLLPADRVGVIQAFMGLPGIVLMLWGGASADRTDPRQLLVRVYLWAPLLPLFLLLVDFSGHLNLWTVTLWGLGMSTMVSFSSPAQQAILNRITGGAVQEGVSAATAIGFLVQMIGLTVAGQMEEIGLAFVLVFQSVCLLIGALLIRRLKPQPSTYQQGAESMWTGILKGLRATYQNRVIFNVLVINFISSIFNAGAFLTVMPFIIKRIYDGDALLLAIIMIVFYAGAMIANVLMLKLMPFKRPGQLYLLMQLSRIIILLLLSIQPAWWLLVATLIGWGVNMGFTSTLARTIVQESATPEYRGRILSVFNLGLLGSAPIGAVVLGMIIEAFGTLNALIPAMFTSMILCGYGIWFTKIWHYQSPQATDSI
jgi:predicted MFS family arabinose efflux permease